MTNPASHLTRLGAAMLLVAAAALPALAQQDVMRDSYGFFGSALDVEVATESPGRIRLIRGQRSRVEVAGRAPDGFTSASLGGRGVRRLTLTALATGPVDFVVSVPEDVRVRVRWEGSGRSELFGTLTETATYAWNGSVERPAFETLRTAPPSAPRPASASASSDVPAIVDIAGAHRLDRLTVRIGEPAFSLSPSHRIDARRAGDALRFDAPVGGDVAVQVPADESITLRLDGVDAIVVEHGVVRVLCESMLSQMLPDGRQWLTLTPLAGRGCGEPPAPARPPTPGISTARRT